MTKIIYLDMDGVLADLEYGLQELWPDVDLTNKGRIFKQYLPKYVEEGGFEHERPLAKSKELVDYILEERSHNKTIEVGILTSAGHFYHPISDVVAQKKRFLEKNFPELLYFPFCVTTSGKDKSLLASKNSLLIDDHVKNIERFVEAGGHGIIYNHNDPIENTFEKIESFIRS